MQKEMEMKKGKNKILTKSKIKCEINSKRGCK